MANEDIKQPVVEYLKRFFLAFTEEEQNQPIVKKRFDKFEALNGFLVLKVLGDDQDDKNLWISVDQSIVECLYEPIVFALAIHFLEFNYRLSSEQYPQEGDKYKKGRETYKVIDPHHDMPEYGGEFIKLECLSRKNAGSSRYVVLEDLNKEYTQLYADANVTNRNTFQYMLAFLKEVIGRKVNISFFPGKYAIVATKHTFEGCFNKTDRRAYPYIYIDRNGDFSRNLETDDNLFYLAPSYEDIKQYVFDEGIKLDTVVFLNKAVDEQIQDDINRGQVKRVISVGREKPKVDSVLRWQWMPLELQHLRNDKPSEQTCQEIEHEDLQDAQTKFIDLLKSVEEQNGISIQRRLLPYIRYCYALVPPSENSRLVNSADDLQEKFRKAAKTILEEAFSDFGGDPTTANEQIVEAFNEMIGQIRYMNNKKSHALRTLRDTYLLIPKHQTKYIWEEDIRGLNLDRVQAITEAGIKELKQGSEITVMEIRDKQFEAFSHQPHPFKWLLYTDECKQFDHDKAKFENDLIKELGSSDRKSLTSVDFPIDGEPAETPGEVIIRIFGETGESETPGGYAPEWQDSIEKKIVFTDASENVLPSSKSVLLVSDGEGLKKYKVGDLTTGDRIRIYENQHEGLLFQVASEANDSGAFNQIQTCSRQWKEALTIYLNTEVSDDDPLLSLLYDHPVIARRELLQRKIDEQHEHFGVRNSTVLKWEETDSTKFPRNDEVFRFLFKDDPDQCNQVIKSKRNYNSIMVALGRDLSDEITDYVLNEVKGPILEKFDDETVEIISDSNMPCREIQSITTV